MNKIPTIFLRNEQGVITPVHHPAAEWVFEGEGVPTRKYDGTCCLVRHGLLYKRRELLRGQSTPNGFEAIATDPITEKTVGWVPVGDGPEDRWHREAFTDLVPGRLPPEGTYELLGPKIQGNPERLSYHQLVAHNDAAVLDDAPRSFEALEAFMRDFGFEGIVWHHPDGRMAKIKKRDFDAVRKSRPVERRAVAPGVAE